MLDAKGVETGLFEISGGGRRFQALSLLVKQKRLAKTAPIPCIVQYAASEILAADDLLAKNMQRVGLHPLDQFRACPALREKGQGEEAIAAAFFVAPQIVKQRLASVAPALLEGYAEDGMTLEQLKALTVEPRPRASGAGLVCSEELLEQGGLGHPSHVDGDLGSSLRAVFVGIGAYEDAGGAVLHDLLRCDGGGWLEEPALLDRLVAEMLQSDAEALRLRTAHPKRASALVSSCTPESRNESRRSPMGSWACFHRCHGFSVPSSPRPP